MARKFKYVSSLQHHQKNKYCFFPENLSETFLVIFKHSEECPDKISFIWCWMLYVKVHHFCHWKKFDHDLAIVILYLYFFWMYVTLFLKLDLRTINQTLHHVITDGVKKEGNNYGFKENKHQIWMGGMAKRFLNSILMNRL